MSPTPFRRARIRAHRYTFVAGIVLLTAFVSAIGLVTTQSKVSLGAGWAVASSANDRLLISSLGNKKISASDTAIQPLVCTPDPIVINNGDSGAGSLRQAILDACDGSTITFDMNQVVSPIIVQAELSIIKSLTITGPRANLLTISGNNQTRVFNVDVASPGAVTLSDLTIANGAQLGNGGVGAGLLKANTGSLTVVNSSFISNSAFESGGGIYRVGAGTLSVTNTTFSGNSTHKETGGGIHNGGSGAINITNSTFSDNIGSSDGGGFCNLGSATITIVGSAFKNNSAGSGRGGGASFSNAGSTITIKNTTFSGNIGPEGGGIYHGGGDARITNVTITNNRSVRSTGGGFLRSPPAMSFLENTIISGNFQGVGTTPGNIEGSVTLTSCLVDVDARLGSLADNGGPTQTHALLSGSPAIDAGSDSLAGNAGLTTDQRGTGFGRIVDGPDADSTDTVDIGAFEAQVSLEDITDKAINEDTQVQFNFNVGGGASITGVTATSSNTALVPNNPANIDVSGSGSTRTVTINPVANVFGTSTITVTVNGNNGQSMSDTFLLTVNAVAETPTVTNAATNEDTQTTSGLIISRNASDGSEVTHFKITGITNGSLFKNNGTTPINNGDFVTFAEGNAGLKFTPAANMFSPSTAFSFQIQAATSAAGAGLSNGFATATITVAPIADTSAVTNATTNEDTQSTSGLVISRNAVDGAEVTHFKITSITNGTLFKSDGTTPIANNSFITFAEGNAGLKFTPAAELFSPATSFSFQVQGAMDGAGSGLSSGLATATITVNSVNDVPSFTKGSDQTVNEDAGARTVSNWATGLSAGPSNESGQTLSFQITNNTNATLFSAGPAIGSTGTLTYTPAANANGTATITIVLKDSGGTANGGVDTSTSQSFTITVNSVNDAPGFTRGANQTVNEDSGAQTVNNWAAAISPGPTDESGQVVSFNVTGNTNTALFSAGPAVSSNGTLTYTPAADANGSATITLVIKDDGGTANGGVDTSASQTLTITVTAVNDVPSFIKGADQTVNNNAGAQTVNNWATNISTGPANESGQTPTFQITGNTNASLFSAGPAISSTGTLTYTPAANAGGTATINVVLKDNGGTANGGVDTSAPQTFNITINPAGGFLAFSAATYNTTESSGFTTITVKRTGTIGQAVTLDYTTSADNGLPCSTVSGVATPKCDFITTLGTLSFGAGEDTKTFTVLLGQDSYVEGPETFNVSLSNPTGNAALGTPVAATVTVADDVTEPVTNVIDDPTNFVRQHYHDFLNREPDPDGLSFWVNQITSCGNDAQCIEVKRINVSASFFLSIEFQQTGYLVERIYKISYGDAVGSSTFNGSHQIFVPVIRANEFLRDTQRIGQGVIVLQPGWEQLLENNKQAYALEFVQTARFLAAFPTSMTPTQFVDKLNQNAGGVLSNSERTTAINLFGGAVNTSNNTARTQALRQIAEDTDLYNNEFNRAFVLAQYFGYLRRNPNDPQDTDYSGYDFWLTKLNQFNGNFVAAEMVKAFLASIEYRQRFGP